MNGGKIALVICSLLSGCTFVERDPQGMESTVCWFEGGSFDSAGRSGVNYTYQQPAGGLPFAMEEARVYFNNALRLQSVQYSKDDVRLRIIPYTGDNVTLILEKFNGGVSVPFEDEPNLRAASLYYLEMIAPGLDAEEISHLSELLMAGEKGGVHGRYLDVVLPLDLEFTFRAANGSFEAGTLVRTTGGWHFEFIPGRIHLAVAEGEIVVASNDLVAVQLLLHPEEAHDLHARAHRAVNENFKLGASARPVSYLAEADCAHVYSAVYAYFPTRDIAIIG